MVTKGLNPKNNCIFEIPEKFYPWYPIYSSFQVVLTFNPSEPCWPKLVIKGLKRYFFMKILIFRYFYTPVKNLMAIITLFHVHLSFEKKGLDSDIKWRKRAIFGMWGLTKLCAQ